MPSALPQPLGCTSCGRNCFWSQIPGHCRLKGYHIRKPAVNSHLPVSLEAGLPFAWCPRGSSHPDTFPPECLLKNQQPDRQRGRARAFDIFAHASVRICTLSLCPWISFGAGMKTNHVCIFRRARVGQAKSMVVGRRATFPETSHPQAEPPDLIGNRNLCRWN